MKKVIINKRLVEFEEALKIIPHGYRMLDSNDLKILNSFSYYHINESIILFDHVQKREITIPLIGGLFCINNEGIRFEHQDIGAYGYYWMEGGIVLQALSKHLSGALNRALDIEYTGDRKYKVGTIFIEK